MKTKKVKSILGSYYIKNSTNVFKLGDYAQFLAHHDYINAARSPHRANSIDSTLDAAGWGLESMMVIPTDEKSRSDLAELAEMLNKLRATVARTG